MSLTEYYGILGIYVAMESEMQRKQSKRRIYLKLSEKLNWIRGEVIYSETDTGQEVAFSLVTSTSEVRSTNLQAEASTEEVFRLRRGRQ